MIKTKMYSSYRVDMDTIQALVNEFLEKNGFQFSNIFSSSSQTDAYSHLQMITLAYDDLGKQQIFDNDYDHDQSRFRSGKLLPKNIIKGKCEHLNDFQPEHDGDGNCYGWYCIDCHEFVKDWRNLDKRNAFLRLEKLGVDTRHLDHYETRDLNDMIKEKTGMEPQHIKLVD